jgi:hypothetical protein
MTLLFALSELICVSDVTNLAWHASDFSSESGASGFSSRIWLPGGAAKSFVPHAAARKELDVHSFSACWRASCTQEKGAVNKIGQFGLVTTQWQSGRKKNCRRARSRYERRVDTDTNKCKIIAAGGRPIRAAGGQFPQKQRRASFRSRRVLRGKKKWYCGTMISPVRRAGPKTDTLRRVTGGKSEISYSGSAKNPNARLGCVAARCNFHNSDRSQFLVAESMNFYGDSCWKVPSTERGSAGRPCFGDSNHW